MSTSSIRSPQHAPPFPCHPGPSILIDSHSTSEEQLYFGTEKEFTSGGRPRVTIDIFPDIALLRIFDFYVDDDQIEWWHTLVHVCRKWRIVVFGSPRRLKLRLLCTAKTPIRRTLDVWPLFPIVVRGDGYKKRGVDSIIAALEQNDRICQLEFVRFPRSEMKEVLSAMQQPFPALTRLLLRPNYASGKAPVIPTSFLGGSASRLQTLVMCDISFPGLPKLLLSAAQLVFLDLWSIPHSGYISPETMVACLSVLTRLERLEIGFEDPQSHPDQDNRHPPPKTRNLLPVLTSLWFQGVSEYLEDFVAQIDTPLLDTLTLSFLHQPMFDTPQLIQFINHTPKFEAHEARVVFDPEFDVWVTLPQRSGGKIRLETTCSPSDQLWSLAQLCSWSIPRDFISAVEHLYIVEGVSQALRFEGDIENSPDQWLELLRPFTAVKALYISRQFALHIAFTLQELSRKSVAEVLPSLQTLFLEERLPWGPVRGAVGEFVAARRLAGHPMAVSYWNGIKDVWDEMEDDD